MVYCRLSLETQCKGRWNEWFYTSQHWNAQRVDHIWWQTNNITMYCTNNFESVSVGLIIVFNHVWYHRIDQFIYWPVRGSHQRSNSYYQYKTTYLYLWSHGTASHSTLAITDYRIIQYNTQYLRRYFRQRPFSRFKLAYFQKYHCFFSCQFKLNSIVV